MEELCIPGRCNIFCAPLVDKQASRMLTLYQWHPGPIGCYRPASRQSIAGGEVSSVEKGFNCRVDGTVFDSTSCCRFQSLKTATPSGSSRRFRRSGENFNRFGDGAGAHHFAHMESSTENCLQGFSVFPLLPLAAIALTFSRAASVMVSLSEEAQADVREVGETKAEEAPLLEEFTEAAKGNLPWRPGLERAMMQQGGISLALLSATAIAQDHLNPIIATLRANPTFMSGLIAWALAQVMKVFTYYVVVRKWDFRMVIGSGGMPSSHSALCFALTTSVAFVHGVSDALFPVCLGFTLIVMYDAAGVRRHAGKQAEVLNMIVADLFDGQPISETKLKELLGHTPLQVFVGAALGVIVGYLCSRPRLL